MSNDIHSLALNSMELSSFGVRSDGTIGCMYNLPIFRNKIYVKESITYDMIREGDVVNS